MILPYRWNLKKSVLFSLENLPANFNMIPVQRKLSFGYLDANAADENGLYPFFTCAERALRINIPAYDCECVLVAGNGDLHVKYYSGKFNAYQRTYIIETKDSDSLTVPYLYRFLDYYVETLRNQSIGGVIKYIKLGNLTEASIPLFEIAEQHNIINLLDCLDAIINKMQQQLFDYDNLVKSRFTQKEVAA